jgi:hypothetical protein
LFKEKRPQAKSNESSSEYTIEQESPSKRLKHEIQSSTIEAVNDELDSQILQNMSELHVNDQEEAERTDLANDSKISDQVSIIQHNEDKTDEIGTNTIKEENIKTENVTPTKVIVL